MQWDAISQTPWYTWHDGAHWHQVWFDNAESIALKFDLAQAQGLQGVGMWALGYDGSRPELWDLIEQQFVTDCPVVGDLNGRADIDSQPARARNCRQVETTGP